MPTLIDLSHSVEHAMITYKGLPGPVISDHLSREASRERYATGTEFQIGRIDMVANTGTYIDAPFHRYAEGKDLSELSLNAVANLDGILVSWDPARGRSIDLRAFPPKGLRGKAVIIRTGWDKHWRTDRYFEGHPFLTSDAADFLVNAGVTLVGIDSLNIDSTDDAKRPVHTRLLGSDIPIVEHLCNLQALGNKRFRFFAVPVKVKQFGSFPVRAFAIVG